MKRTGNWGSVERAHIPPINDGGAGRLARLDLHGMQWHRLRHTAEHARTTLVDLAHEGVVGRVLAIATQLLARERSFVGGAGSGIHQSFRADGGVALR